jgi:hypothetical protein
VWLVLAVVAVVAALPRISKLTLHELSNVSILVYPDEVHIQQSIAPFRYTKRRLIRSEPPCSGRIG